MPVVILPPGHDAVSLDYAYTDHRVLPVAIYVLLHGRGLSRLARALSPFMIPSTVVDECQRARQNTMKNALSTIDFAPHDQEIKIAPSFQASMDPSMDPQVQIIYIMTKVLRLLDKPLGCAIVTSKDPYLFTDGRYFLQAEQQRTSPLQFYLGFVTSLISNRIMKQGLPGT